MNKTEKELIKAASDHIAEACCFLFECESELGKTMAVLCDTMLKLAHINRYDDDLLIATTSYDEFEAEKYDEFLKKRRLKLVVNNKENHE